MITHLAVLATSCFPNCHPNGEPITTAQQSGNMALGLAFIGLIVLIFLSRKGSKGGK
jgi:hypothetical protein